MLVRFSGRYVKTGALVGAVLALAGCGGATQPDTQIPHAIGEFDLLEYDGKALPTALDVVLVGVSGIAGDTRSYSCSEILTAAKIELASDSAVSRSSHISYPCTGTLPHPSIPASATQVEYGSVRTTGDSLTFSFTAQSGATSTEYARVAATDLVFYLMRQGSLLGGSVGTIHRVYRRELGTNARY